MSNYQSTEVYNYLSYLEHYLIDDLATFHKICEEAEVRENVAALTDTASSVSSLYSEAEQTTSSTATTQTTIYTGNTPTHSFPLIDNDQNISRMTIPITLALFATVDCVGYLSGANKDPRKTNENFSEFFKQSTIPVTEDESVFLNQVFRQGLTHVYFPKLGLGISYHSQNPTENLFFKNSYGSLILNVNRLETSVVSTFRIIKANENLYTLMENRYQSLKSDYQSKHGNSIANYLA